MQRSCIAVIFLISLVICSALPPIVIVPGIGGSQVEAKLDRKEVKHYWCDKQYTSWFTLWLSIEELLPLAIECWTDNMKLVFDGKTKTMANTDGVFTRIPGFGNTSTIEYLDPNLGFPGTYFAPLVNALVAKLGYKKGVNLRAAPYDFRYGPESSDRYFLMLKMLIEETYDSNGNTKIALMSQSMGCPFTHYFLHRQTKEWKDMYISAWITISGVFAGAVKAVRAYISGDPFGVPTTIDKPVRMRPAQRSYSSLAFILPAKEFWKKDEVIVKTDKRTYTAHEFHDLFIDLEYPLGNVIRSAVPDIWSPVPPNLPMYCFHGSHLPTPGILEYGPGQFPDEQPSIKADDGDGTVNIRSLRACLEWKGNQSEPVYHKEFPGAEHNGIIGDARLIAAVFSALQSL